MASAQMLHSSFLETDVIMVAAFVIWEIGMFSGMDVLPFGPVL